MSVTNATAADATLPLFVYGTLRFPEVLETLLGRVPASDPASLDGWRAAALEGRPYPGLVPEPDGHTRGLLLRGLTAKERAIIDEFEDSAYEQREVPLTDGRRARTYVWLGGDVLAQEWTAEAFAERVLAAYATKRS